MQKTTEELLEVLDMLIANHKKLLTIEKKKLSSIVDQDWKNLELLLEKSKQVLEKIENVENVRLSLVKDLCGRKDATIGEIESTIASDMGPELKKRSSDLISIMEEQKLINENIEKLLKNSLEIVNFSISLISGMGAKGQTYSGSGKERGAGQKHTSFVFDIKA
jgi:hypothetical protein